MTRVAIITGASGSLGSAVASCLGQAGWALGLVDRSTHGPSLEKFASTLPRALALPLASNSTADFEAVITRASTELGSAPEAAVLIAGGWAGGTAFHQEKGDEQWRRMLDSNLETARVALQGLLPGMVAAQRGSIVAIGSRAAVRPWESAGAAAYATSKAALLALVQSVAQEVLESGVRVNAVLPSTIDTEANRKSMPTADFSRWVPRERLAQVIAFLLSEAATDISGAVLPVYGRVK